MQEFTIVASLHGPDRAANAAPPCRLRRRLGDACDRVRGAGHHHLERSHIRMTHGGQGPHQVALKAITTGFSVFRTSASILLSSNSRATALSFQFESISASGPP